MARRGYIPKRKLEPDTRYNNVVVAEFINRVMHAGKKSTATTVVYDALAMVGDRMKKDPIEVFDAAMNNVTPVLEVKPRRVGGATYQVPVEVPPERRMSLAMRWLLAAAHARPGKSMPEKLAAEIMDAANNTGAAVKRRDETHRMAEANRAFAHYRW